MGGSCNRLEGNTYVYNMVDIRTIRINMNVRTFKVMGLELAATFNLIH